MHDRLRARAQSYSPARRADPEQRLEELARSRGALRWVLARLAAALAGPQRGWERLGYVRADDYSRERLGRSDRWLLDLARVGRTLSGLPGLEAALASGALPWSKVRLLARFVTPEDESRWIALACRLGVRELERRVRAVDRGALGAASPAEPDRECDEEGASTEPVETVALRVGSRACFKWRRAQRWASRVAGERVSPGTALEMITAEALSALPTSVLATSIEAPVDEASTGGNQRARAANVCAPQGPAPEGPCAVAPPPEPPGFLRPLLVNLDQADAFELDARLRRAVRLEQRLDAEVAGLLHRVTSSDYEWRTRPRTLAVLARDRLGMSPRRARALLRLERACDGFPELRAAWRDGSISWVQAQILLPLLIDSGDGLAGPGWRAAWLGFARRVTVRRLDEVVGEALTLRKADPSGWLRCGGDPERLDPDEPCQADACGERQTCARPRDLFQGIRVRVSAPRDVARLFRAVLCSLRRAAEAETGSLPSEGEAFEAMLDHAMRAWRVDDPRLRGRAPARDRRLLAVFDRDEWRCTVPGCSSHRNLHAHHIRFRSAGGSDEPANLTTLCAAHHHRGVHAGRVRVSGQAPGALWFELGVRADGPPLACYRSGDRVA